MCPSRGSLTVLILWFSIVPAVGHAGQNTLDRAKDLYTSAAYEEALVVLSAIPAPPSLLEKSEIAEYRVFCLLALGRSDEAREEIERLVRLDPTYRPSETLASPRVRAAVDEVRSNVLPEIVRELFAAAKTAYDEKQLARAATEFDRVLQLLDDPALAEAEESRNLRTLATGFRDLSRSLAEQEASAAATIPAPPPTRASATEIYDATDAKIIRPAILSQQMPVWRPRTPAEAQQEFRGSLELVIDEAGKVASVDLTDSVHPAYDRALLQFARKWKFRPAMREGSPVKFREVMTIRLRPSS